MDDGDQRIPVAAGQACLLRRGRRYRGRHDPRRPLTVTAVHYDLLDEAGAPVEAPADWPLALRLGDPGLVRGLAARLRESWPDDAATAAVWFAALHAEVLRERRSAAADAGDRAIDAVRVAVSADPAQAWTVDGLARRCGWRRHHFARRFHRRSGCPPQEFILRERLRAAQDLLLGSDLPVARIAEALGYRDPAFFCRQFTARLGLPPAAWRRRERGG